MLSLEKAIRDYCDSQMSKEEIVEHNSITVAYSILENIPLDKCEKLDLKNNLNEEQLDDLYAIKNIVHKIKQEIEN